jgi:uncharacterized iron-regulated membrane protein
VFQVHLWLGLVLGLYIAVLSLSGSALVFRDELTQALDTPMPVYQEGRRPLTRAQLTQAAQREYPGWEVTRVGNQFTRRRPVVEIWVERGGERRQRLFNPYTGEEVGEALPAGVQAMIWTANLHNELLMGETGKRINGVGSALVVATAVTGIVVWWPGVQRWRRALGVRWRSRWPVFTFDLHSALGVWFFGLIALWGLSGLYMAFPDPVHAVIDAYSRPDAILGERPADIVLRWFVRLHFGRWGDLHWLSAAWVLMGLVPAAMFVTGTIMWWNRRRKAVVNREW